MSTLPTLDPALLRVWHALLTQFGADETERFFENHVIDGGAIVASFLQATPVPSDTSPLVEPATPSGTVALSVAPAVASPASVVPPVSTGPTPLNAPPTTRIDLRRHMLILDRKWLVTGFVLRIYVPGQVVRRIPMNYSTILLGYEGSQSDIEVPLWEGCVCRLRFTWTGQAFSLAQEGGPGTVTVNEATLGDPAELKDGDVIRLGQVNLRLFHVLDLPAELVVVNGLGAGERFAVDTSVVRLGRYGKRDNDINLQDPTVSREHASIWFRDGRYWLVAESSTSPTVVNGERVGQPRGLNDNDQIVLGEQTLLFRVRGAMPRPKTLRSRLATILFSDLRGWTSLAESWPLQDLMLQMDEYFKAMGDIITMHGGTLLTYQGDAIMAVFGAPSSHKDDPWRAVSSAVRMQHELRLRNQGWQSAGKPPLTCGVGVHTGLCMVGEMGHQSRLEYTAMGDTANLAARLEQLTRDLGCDIIISDTTYAEVADCVDVDSLGEVTVRGRSVPTHAYSVRGLREGT